MVMQPEPIYLAYEDITQNIEKKPREMCIRDRFIAQMAGGDARRALNAVELGILTTEPDENGRILIDLAAAEECIQRKAVNRCV